MTLSRQSIPAPSGVSDATKPSMSIPWVATGVITPQEARRLAEAIAADPALEDDLCAARAEREAVSAMGEALGRPSVRPMLELFAAIDGPMKPVGSNVTRVTFPRAPRLVFAAFDLKEKKFGRLR